MQVDQVQIKFGNVKEKTIVTPNHFVSHMIEHIAWRLGVSISLHWMNENWRELGNALGREINKFPKNLLQSSCLGMIDDGSAIVSIGFSTPDYNVHFKASGDVDLAYFLKLRCEQLDDGSSLVELLSGLADGLKARIDVNVCSLEDTHHTWEGVYRAVGIALNRIYAPEELVQRTEELMQKDPLIYKHNGESELMVLEVGFNQAIVRRGTAETGITLAVSFEEEKDNEIIFDVDPSINLAINGFHDLFRRLSKSLGVKVKIDFKSTLLSSSHVVMEDIGLVFGRALLEILKLRMEKYGVNAAGSNISSIKQESDNMVHVALSVEGRKFWQILSDQKDKTLIRKEYILGINADNNLRGEDLDDFIDGLSGGLSASIIIIIKDQVSPLVAWNDIYSGLGLALKEVFRANPYRQGVPPGVKATLS